MWARNELKEMSPSTVSMSASRKPYTSSEKVNCTRSGTSLVWLVDAVVMATVGCVVSKMNASWLDAVLVFPARSVAALAGSWIVISPSDSGVTSKLNRLTESWVKLPRVTVTPPNWKSSRLRSSTASPKVALTMMGECRNSLAVGVVSTADSGLVVSYRQIRVADATEGLVASSSAAPYGIATSMKASSAGVSRKEKASEARYLDSTGAKLLMDAFWITTSAWVNP